MRFHVHKRRQPPAIIIVALIDILIVLLIFLMVTTTFKQQAALKLALPDSTQAKKAGANESPPMIVSIDPQGSLRFGVEAKPITREQLKEELLAALAKNPEVELAINADKTAPFGQIVKVMDTAAEVKLKHPARAFMKESSK